MSYVFQQKFEEASSKNDDFIAKILFLHVLPLLKIKKSHSNEPRFATIISYKNE